MRKFLLSISPLSNTDRIKAPLFVIHGRNDPRVPEQETEQIAALVASKGVPVWVMIAESEGHRFAKKETADHLFYARVLLLESCLLSDKERITRRQRKPQGLGIVITVGPAPRDCQHAHQTRDSERKVGDSWDGVVTDFYSVRL